MLLGSACEKLECCKFVICFIDIELVYTFLVHLNKINEYNIEFFFDPLMGVIICFC